jgi:undecaprenyl-phosphate 4-deoxy-4-formamido-L-arabinose transferase
VTVTADDTGDRDRRSFRVSVVVPCYRDEAGLPLLFERLAPVLERLSPAELILVDDGSLDRTADRARELAAGYEHPTTVVQLLRNFGQHAAVFAGLAEARGAIVVTMDSDLQYPPEAIELLVEGVTPTTPVVSGMRIDRHDPWFRRVVSRSISWWLSRRTGVPLHDYGSMFRAYDRRVVDLLLTFDERRRFVPALVGWLGVPVREIEVPHAPRGEAGSRYRLRLLVEMLLDLMTGYATFPLRIVSLIGFLTAIVGFIGSVSFVVYRLALGSGVSGLVSAMALVFFLIAVQLFVMAMFGEYLGRVYIEAKGRPYYLVDRVDRRD